MQKFELNTDTPISLCAVINKVWIVWRCGKNIVSIFTFMHVFVYWEEGEDDCITFYFAPHILPYILHTVSYDHLDDAYFSADTLLYISCNKKLDSQNLFTFENTYFLLVWLPIRSSIRQNKQFYMCPCAVCTVHAYFVLWKLNPSKYNRKICSDTM